MVTARSGQQFEATLEGVATDLVGTVALTVDNAAGTAVIARATTSIVELSSGSDPGAGVYVATRTAPTLADDVPQALYTLIWDLGDPDDADENYTETLLVRADPSFTYLPNQDEVGILIRARTYDVNGNELGTFSQDTTPTDIQVARLIDVAASDVAIEVGTSFHDNADQEFAARRAVALRAAMLVELSYFQEQVNSDQSAYPQLAEMYADVIAKLSARIDDNLAAGVRVYSVGVTSPTMAAVNGVYSAEDEA